jgi:hypothetical protein
VVPSGSLSPVTASPPAGVLQVAASSENDEHASTVPSPSTQQPRTNGDGVLDTEQVMSLSASGSTGHDVTARAGRQGQDPQDRNPMPPASGTTSPSPSFPFSSSTSSSSLQHQAQGVDIDWLVPTFTSAAGHWVRYIFTDAAGPSDRARAELSVHASSAARPTISYAQLGAAAWWASITFRLKTAERWAPLTLQVSAAERRAPFI